MRFISCMTRPMRIQPFWMVSHDVERLEMHFKKSTSKFVLVSTGV